MSEPLNAPSMLAEGQLTYQGEVSINFFNSPYQWIDIKLFALPHHPIDDHAALSLLLRHARYRDHYSGTTDNGENGVTRQLDLHGPYRLDAITTDSFAPVEEADVEAALLAWAEHDAPLPDTAREKLEHELYPRIRNATSRYRLATPSPRRDQADIGPGMTGFHELVLIDRTAGTVALVAASYD